MFYQLVYSVVPVFANLAASQNMESIQPLENVREYLLSIRVLIIIFFLLWFCAFFIDFQNNLLLKIKVDLVIDRPLCKMCHRHYESAIC